MWKKAWVLILTSVAANAGLCDTHQLRTVRTQKKALPNSAFNASMQLMLNSSVGMLQTRVARRTAFLSEQKKCAKK